MDRSPSSRRHGWRADLTLANAPARRAAGPGQLTTDCALLNADADADDLRLRHFAAATIGCWDRRLAGLPRSCGIRFCWCLPRRFAPAGTAPGAGPAGRHPGAACAPDQGAVRIFPL